MTALRLSKGRTRPRVPDTDFFGLPRLFPRLVPGLGVVVNPYVTSDVLLRMQANVQFVNLHAPVGDGVQL